MKISIHGLGKLGAPMAGVFAEVGHDVIGVDKSGDVAKLIAQGISPYQENGLQELLQVTKIATTTDNAAAATASDISFVIVPTPSNKKGLFINDYVLEVLEDIGRGVGEKGTEHTVVVTSTITPRSCDTVLMSAVKKHSKENLIHFCYSPEFIALGTVIRDMKNPDFVLIGEDQPGDSALLVDVYRSYLPDVPYRIMNLVSAELAKLTLNTYVTTKISFANMVAEICEHVPGANARTICEAIGLDRRIGTKGMIPATGYGGPCFGRDSVAFSAFADKYAVSCELAEATESINHRQARRLLDMARTKGAAKIGIFGMTYKVGTPITEDSVGGKLNGALTAAGIDHLIYDPTMNPGSAGTILAQVDTVIITTPWPEFATLDFTGKTVIDCWNIATSGNIVHIGVGA